MSYNDNYSLIAYGQMIEDLGRFQPWLDALRRHIHEDSVVLDIGCGPGAMSFLACRFGARKVYAIEPDGSIEVAKRCAAGIPGADRIEWIRGMSTQIDLPEQADIVVGDLHGNLPFYTSNIASLADARKRHLKPAGILLPRRDQLYAVPASAPWEIDAIEAPWRRNALDLDLTPALSMLVNQFWRARGKETDAERLLAEPAHWGTVDYHAAEETRGLDSTLDWTLDCGGRVDGLYVWFDGEVDTGLGFSNSPLLPELQYGRAFFPLEHPVDVHAGDRMQTRLSVRRMLDNWVFRWDTRITDAASVTKASFKQSTFRMQPEDLALLRKSDASHAPVLAEDGQIRLMVLSMMDGQHSLSDIANVLLARHPKQFRNFEMALAEAASCSRRFG